jgi:hypothetical protein
MLEVGDEATSWIAVATGEESADRWRTTTATKGARSVDGEQSGGKKRTTTIRPASRVAVRSLSRPVQIQLLFASSTARRTKQWLTIKKNDEKQKEQRTTVKPLRHFLLTSRELVTQRGKINRRSETLVRTSRTLSLSECFYFCSSINSFH